MNIQQRNSAYHFRMQSEREQTLGGIIDVATASVHSEKTRLKKLIMIIIIIITEKPFTSKWKKEM